MLGPLVTDIAPGYDHITSAIGGCAAAFYGASFLCYVTPREHLGLPNTEDVRTGVVAAKIAAHAGDVARGLKGVADRDRTLSVARGNLDWPTHIATSLDPQTADRMHRRPARKWARSNSTSADYCSMCGQHWCSMPDQQGDPGRRRTEDGGLRTEDGMLHRSSRHLPPASVTSSSSPAR